MFKFAQKPTEETNYIVGGTWSKLNKALREYKKAKEEFNISQMKIYSKKIQSLQKKLGLKESKFPELEEFEDNTYR